MRRSKRLVVVKLSISTASANLATVPVTRLLTVRSCCCCFIRVDEIATEALGAVFHGSIVVVEVVTLCNT